jgi:2,3-bisphosphoglycerate-independent phosphoglycerate mutase
VLLVTADHGNAEQMRDPVTGNPHTAHTTNPVPFLMVGDGLKFKEAKGKAEEGKKEGEEGKVEEEEDPPAICDVAPTILDIMVRVFFFFYALLVLWSDDFFVI